MIRELFGIAKNKRSFYSLKNFKQSKCPLTEKW